MAAFCNGVKDPDLIKKLSRKNTATVWGLFNMADRYASQEEALLKEEEEQPTPKEKEKEKKDALESSKSKRTHKRPGEIMVATTDHSRPPRAPHIEDFDKVMKSQCPFHPQGKHRAEDYCMLKHYMVEHSR